MFHAAVVTWVGSVRSAVKATQRGGSGPFGSVTPEAGARTRGEACLASPRVADIDDVQAAHDSTGPAT
jgi:hypothetical protein